MDKQLEDLPDTVDIVILGTDISQSIFAAACARNGFTVLHLDRNDFYGDKSSVFTFDAFQEFSSSSDRERIVDLTERDILSESEKLVSGPTKDREAFTFYDNKFVDRLECATVDHSIQNSSDTLPKCDDRVEKSPETVSPNFERFHKLSRKFNIDLSPNVVYSMGKTVELLISSDVARYIEFKSIGKLHIYNDCKFELVPCSRADVFSEKRLSLVEKRLLMRLFASAMESTDVEAGTASFEDYLRQDCRLSENLAYFVIHAIAMTPGECTIAEGLAKIRAFLKSCNVYGPTPYLWPLYGSAELPQAFCRLAAVYGAIYILRSKPSAFVLNTETSEVTGIILENEKRISCKYVVSSSSYCPLDFMQSISEPSCPLKYNVLLRALMLTDKSLFPNSEEKEYPAIHLARAPIGKLATTIIELPSHAMVCPNETFLHHASATVNLLSTGLPESDSWKADMHNFTNFFQNIYNFQSDSSQNEKPNVMWYANFAKPFLTVQTDVSVTADNFKLKANFYVLPDSIPNGSSLDFDRSIDFAELIFKSIKPDADEFIPKMPQPPITEDLSVETIDNSPNPTPQTLEESSDKTEALEPACESVEPEKGPICAEQISKLQLRHQHDLELLDDIHTFSKQRATAEATYAKAIAKLVQQQMAKKDHGPDSETAKVWKSFIEETEQIGKCHQQMADVFLHEVCEPAQILRKSKAQVLRKVVDQLSTVQKEALQTSHELSECHKNYVKEETAAADARQKAEQLEDKVKKKSTGFFQSFTSLQKKSEKTSGLRDQLDFKSTSARNSYIIQLTLANSQIAKYFEQDLPSLIRQLDSNVTGQIQQFLATICRSELETCNVALRGLGSVQTDVEQLCGQKTMQSFFHDFPVFTDVVQYQFEPIEGDHIDHVSTQHGGDEMIIAEARKFANFMTQESRNINSLKQELANLRRTLVNAGRLASPGETPAQDHAKSVMAIVEDVDARLDDLRMAIRRSRTNKMKAETVLNLFKSVGIDVSSHVDTSGESEDDEDDEETVCTDIRALQHQLRVGAAQPNLLSSFSPNLSSGRISSLSVHAASSTTASPVPSPHLTKSEKSQQPKSERVTSMPASVGSTVDIKEGKSEPPAAVHSVSISESDKAKEVTPNHSIDDAFKLDEEEASPAVDDGYDVAPPTQKWSSGLRFPLYGVSLYDYQAGNYDELNVFAGDRLEIVGDGDSEGWLMARSSLGQSGFIPHAYLATFSSKDELDSYIAEMEREHRESVSLAQQQTLEENQQELLEDQATVPSLQLTQASPTTELADNEMKKIESESNVSAEMSQDGGPVALEGEVFAQAVYDFDGVDEDELCFLEGDVIRILARSNNGVDDGYWFGELNGGRRGWFPSMVVEVLDSSTETVPLPGELKSPDSGPPEFIPPPPVVLIEATPLPTPLDSPTGSGGKRGKGQERSQEEDADSGFEAGANGSMNQPVQGQSTQDDEEDQSTQQEPVEEPDKQIQEDVEESEPLAESKGEVADALRQRAAEITEIVLSEAREAIGKESVEDEEVEEHENIDVEDVAAVVTEAIEEAAATIVAGDIVDHATKAEEMRIQLDEEVINDNLTNEQLHEDDDEELSLR